MVTKYIIPKTEKIVNTPLSELVKTYPQLNIASLNLHVDKQLVIAYLLKYINTNHSGLILQSYAVQQLEKQFNYSESTIYRLLESGDGLFYVRTKDKLTGQRYIKIHGYKKIAENLGVEYVGCPISVNFKKVHKRQAIRGLLFGTFFKTAHHKNCNHPMSRQTITKKTGLNVRQQQRYEKVAPIEVRENFTDDVVVYSGKYKEYTMNRQIPNTYISQQGMIGVKGQIKKINKYLRLWQKTNESFQNSDGAKHSKKPQLYFADKSIWETFKNKLTAPLEYATFILESYGANFSKWTKCTY